MELEILLRRYARLRQELAAAYRSHPWQSGRIDPLADALAKVEHHIARLRPLQAVPSPVATDVFDRAPLQGVVVGMLSDTQVPSKSRY